MAERDKRTIRETSGIFAGVRRAVTGYFQGGNARRGRQRREVTIDRSLLMTETAAHDVAVNSVADAMSIAVVNRCVQLISGAVSALPLRLLAWGSDGVFAPVPEGDANNLQYLLSVQPNDRDSAVEFWSRAIQQMLLLGNAYVIPRYYESAPYALRELRPEQTAYGVRDTDTAAHLEARDAAYADTAGGDRRPRAVQAPARVDAVDTAESERVAK